MQKNPNFTAQLTFYPDVSGQQQTPISSGHRVRLRFSFTQEEVVAILNFDAIELVYPGDTVPASVILVNAPEIAKQAYAGQDFELYANEQQTGHGVITEILKSTA